MSQRLYRLIALAALAGCSTSPAQQAAGTNLRTMVIPLALEPPPVYALIGYRDRLELTSQQVNALDSIAVTTREQNRGLITELEQKAVTNSRAPGVLQVNPEERPLLEQIRVNNRRVLDGVAEVLTPAQETEVCELYQPDRPNTPNTARRRTELDDAYMRDRDVRADSSRYVRGFSVWPWCATNEGRAEG